MKSVPQFVAHCRLAALALLALLLIPHAVFGQANPNPPGQISYQGFLVDNNGLPLATNAPRNYNIIFRIYPSSSGDTNTPLWAEQQVVTVDKGYFSVLLGQGSAVGSQPNTNNLTGLFTGATASDRYIGLVVQGLAVGGDVEITPRLRLLSSPYALLAANANSLVSSAGSNIVSTFGGFVGINKGGANPASVLDVNGTVTATNFSGSGAGLFGINAGNITTGTLPDARLSGNVVMAGGNPTFSTLTVNNNLSANNFSAAYPLYYGGSSLPASSSFVSHGGYVILFCHTSCWTSTAGYKGVSINVDSSYFANMTMYLIANTHLDLPGNTFLIGRIPAGTHTVTMAKTDSSVNFDSNDNYQITMLELPF